MDEDVVGVGVWWTAKQIAAGVVPYERVRGAYYCGPKNGGLVGTEAFEEWVDMKTENGGRLATQAADICRRLWADGKVLQPRLLGGDVPSTGSQHFIKWRDLDGQGT